MNQSRNLLVIVVILSLLAGIFLFLNFSDRDSTLSSADTAFALQDSLGVTGVRLTQVQEGIPITTIDLQKNQEEIWMVNGTYRAFEPQIGYLLTTLRRLQVKEVLTGQGIESAEKILGLVHTRVEITDANGPVKTYLLGTSARDSKGSLMKLEGARQPFIVERPDLQGFINPFFTIDVDIWREKLLWRATAADLASIRIEHTDSSEKNLWMSTDTESPWTLQPGGETPDPEKLNAYLDQFQGAVYAESFASRKDPEKLEELKERKEDVRLILEYRDGNSTEVVLYLREDNPNSYYGWVIGEEELYTIQHFVFDKFLVSNQSFQLQAGV